MAALTLTAKALLGLALSLGISVSSRADDPKATPTPAPAPAPASAPAPARVVVEFRISGLGPGGCDVEIAPGSSECQFRTMTQHITPQDVAYGKKVTLDDVRTSGLDRYCIFAITIREPGQPAKIVRRGLRLVGTTGRQETAQVLPCYVSSPSRLAKATEMRDRR
jgi:hypothetical protein